MNSGKQSTTRIASFVCELQCVQLEITRGYGIKDFHEELKKFMIAAGVQNTQVAFMLTGATSGVSCVVL